MSTVDNRVEHLDSGMRRNDGVSEIYPQILRKIRFFVALNVFVIGWPTDWYGQYPSNI
jgi:hypothetical protein